MVTTFWLLAAGHLLLAAAEGCPTFDFWELAATVGPVLASRPLSGASAPAFIIDLSFSGLNGPPGAPTCRFPA